MTQRETTTEPTASIQIVRALAEAVFDAGGSRPALLRGAGLDEAQLDDAGARVPYAVVWRACELAMELTRDPAFALHWAEKHAAHSFAPVAHLMLHAANLREGLASLSRFERLFTDSPVFAVIEAGNFFTLRCTPSLREASAALKRFASDMKVAAFLRLFRSFGAEIRAERIAFQHEAPSYEAEYARLLGQPVLFSQPHTEMVFERALLDAPSPYRDQGAHAALHVLAQDRVARITQGASYAPRVRNYMVEHGGKGRLNMQSVARALGISARSLRRRLDAEGKSYRELENEAMATVAKHMLRDKQLSIQETADALGFTSTSTFHHAFKRWTGTTPNTTRRGERE